MSYQHGSRFQGSSSRDNSPRDNQEDDIDIDTESSSDEKIKRERVVVPAKPPKAKIIASFKPDEEEPPKKEKKTSKKSERPRRRSSVKREEGAIEPAPQILFAAGDEENSEKHKKRSKKSRDGSTKKRRSKRSRKNSTPSDAKSLVTAKLARSTERFDDSKSVFVKRNPAIGSSTSRRPPLPPSRGILGLANSQFAFESKKQAKDTDDDVYVTILTIPTDDNAPPRQEKPHKHSKMSSLSASTPSLKKSKPHLPLPVFSALPKNADGLKPIETMAETMEMQTNAFNEDRYEGAEPIRRHSSHQEALLQPIHGWLKFQVPIIPRPDDTEYEREATKQFDISRLLHQAKSC